MSTLTRTSKAGKAEASPASNPLRRLYAWVVRWAESRYGTAALAAVAFSESSFFPVPPDPLQIALSVGRPRRALWFATVSTVFSVTGGILGWWIGLALWHAVEPFFFQYVPGFTEESFRFVQTRYQESAFIAILAAAFTPIPYKVFTIASGVFNVGLPTLVVASLLGRGARFFGIGLALHILGPRVERFLHRYLEVLAVVFFVLLVGAFFVIKWLL